MMYILKPNDKISFNITYFISPACFLRALRTSWPRGINWTASGETENLEHLLSTWCARTLFFGFHLTHLLCSCLQPSSLGNGSFGQNHIYYSNNHFLEYCLLTTLLTLFPFHMPSIEQRSLSYILPLPTSQLADHTPTYILNNFHDPLNLS